MAVYELLRSAMRTWYGFHFAHSGAVPKPIDDPTSRSQKADADQVLLLGNGPCHGWGVRTHQLGLTGHLARALAERTGREATVDYVGDERMNIRSAKAWVGQRDLTHYDIISVVMGVNDAVRLTPVAQWTERLRDLLAFLLDGTDPSVRIVVTPIQPVRSVEVFRAAPGAVAQWHASRLNAATRELVETLPRVQFGTLSASTEGPSASGKRPGKYFTWGQEIADQLAPLLDRTREERRVHPDAVPHRWQWAVTEKVKELAKVGGSPEMQRIAETAQELFDVEFAVVTMLDGDRLWYANNTHILPQSLPREIAYCQTTVEEDSLLLVPDAQKDPRFRDGPLVEMIGLPFYLGVPLRSREGASLGTFCLLGAKPRRADAVSLPRFHELAADAQRELWRMEDEAATEAAAGDAAASRLGQPA